MKDPCVVCGAESQGGRGGHSLCDAHWKEVEQEDLRRANAHRDYEYRSAQAKFAREYPGIRITKRGLSDS